MSADRTLGISPGTRAIGLAVTDTGNLLHSRVHSFQGKWSDTKLQMIISLIDKLLREYKAVAVVVKLPDTLPLSKGFHQLVGSINVLCKRHTILPRYYSLSEIRKHHCVSRNPSRNEFMELLVHKHPELIIEYRKEQHNRHAYYNKLFEAVAASRM